jgi:hypothetical protein
MLKSISIGVGFFIGIDYLLKKFNIEGRYYFNHAVCNSMVVYNTYNSMLSSYNIMSIITPEQLESLDIARITVCSLHLYHIIWYFRSLRKDDWLHHLLMVGLSLPLTYYIPQGNTIAHGLFFTTGLPGLIDYLLLFFNRNNLIHKYIEKRVNLFLNLWIRAPGCIMNACIGGMNLITNCNQFSNYHSYACMIIMGSMYWNGIYFMEQVVTDYAKFNK